MTILHFTLLYCYSQYKRSVAELTLGGITLCFTSTHITISINVMFHSQSQSFQVHIPLNLAPSVASFFVLERTGYVF